jgi:hypothetical protein
MPPKKKTTVVNMKEPHDVYIGRGSPFGNPFSHLPDGVSKYPTIRTGSKEGSVAMYRLWLTTDYHVVGWTKPSKAAIAGLAGKTLGCHCISGPCHGHVLVELLEAPAGDE